MENIPLHSSYVEWYHCHVRFADIQHNFEITYLHLNYTGCRSSHQTCSTEKLFLKLPQYSRENTCVGFFFKKSYRPKAWNFIKKKVQTQVFSCEHFREHLSWRTSANGYFCGCPVGILQPHKHLWTKITMYS